MTDEDLVQVVVEAPLLQPLIYRFPRELGAQRPGVCVRAPLGRGFTKGVVVGPAQDAGGFEIKDISEVIPGPPLGERTLAWLKWLAQYYLHPPGLVYSLAFAPGDEKRKRPSKKTSPTQVNLSVSSEEILLNLDQKRAVEEIALANNKFEKFLLYGITGSGKTEVYLKAIEQVLALKKQALVLVPEISLTPQLIKRFVMRFGENVAVIHSHLTSRERADQWWSMVKGEKNILIGARSALFCPSEKLGLIIVDEEHEGGFKQEEKLKYNARDSAVMRALFSGCPVILGSATPSLESWHNVKVGKYKLLELPHRVENRPLPSMELIDMRLERQNRQAEKTALPFWMSQTLHAQLVTLLKNREQGVLFLNRRGFAQLVLCQGCGFTEHCPHCSVTLTAHNRGARLHCHYCGFQKPTPPLCTSCKQNSYKTLGLGTESVSEDLKNVFPEARVARADRDEVNSRESLENLLQRILNQDVDLIVGTQMIAKGHDFPNLTLVAALLADVGLHLPDFRSTERTFQLLTQVAGRAGRHGKSGKVFIQTFVPQHPAIQGALRHDFEKFAEEELKNRETLLFPPYGRLAILRIQGANQEKVEMASMEAKKRVLGLQKLNQTYSELEVLGPCEAPLAKLKDKHRYQLLLKTRSAKLLNLFLQHLVQNQEWMPSGTKLSVDVDPQQLL